MEGSSIQAAPHDIENQYKQLEASMMEELDTDRRVFPMSHFRCIFRVPVRLRRVRTKAYTPKAISIGPLHHGKKYLKAMEVHKRRYLQYFMDRSNLSLMHYIKIIKVKEAKLRSCYPETIVFKSDEFVRMILVDAVFIIEFLFRCSYLDELQDENDCMFGKGHMVEDVWPDLLMLENQLPFFILDDLFDPHIFPVPPDRLNGVERLSILWLSHKFLDGVPTFGGMLDDLETINSYSQVEHFVDLLRKLCIATILKEQSAGVRSKFATAPTIAKLHQSGVKFKKRSTKNLFDIRFDKDGILEIPKFRAYDETELILRNVVAFEQCACVESYISDYVAIMDMFVDSPKDVGLLVQYKIVENGLGGGDNELSTMINSVSTGVNISSKNFYYASLCKDLNEFCSYKWHKRMANLRQNYFNTPWATISFLGALLLLILTVVQTICSIISLS